MTFKRWIGRYEENETKSGELARLVAADDDFPHVRSKVFIEAHLYNVHEDEEIITVFRREWKKYLEFLREMEY